MPKFNLLPCPFCGKAEALRMERIPFVYNLVCAVANGGCGASTGWNHATPEEAVKSWNTRASGWIPCSERMPECDGFYLAYYTFADGRHACDMVYFNIGSPISSSITHWMTLPEPPKEVHHDEN